MLKHLKLLAFVAICIVGVGLLIHDDYMYLMIVAHLTLIPAVGYPLVYRKSPWRKGPTGKALFNMAVAVALLYVVGLFRLWWPFPGGAELYAITVTYLGVAITYQFAVMLKLKREAKKQRSPEMQP